ncbi:uncharacterized protein LOC131212885 isoform X2 [Anopheles bellator]|uniref:uncharacterized protein LOC131212885 isoform X2 n=1 Tax=Anopheles bellator TaxID=139047 RepID=UPI0026490F1E|nr:uncharacterized protein LOC131212885 isoform X2 [Anopheles bellator]
MDPTQITALANLLKESGDKVLNSQFKLSLSASLLRALNDSFSLIVDKNEILPPQSFQVVKPNNAKSDVFRDLQFVYDFVQKTIILSLNQFLNDDLYESAVDISKFRSLRTLEVQKIPINQVVGINHLKNQLRDLSCVRSISHVSDVLVSCGGDKMIEKKQWRALKNINFAYNMLDYVDSSLELTPLLEVLNLSHNQLVNVSAVRYLPNLREINLSYNRLNSIPAFHVDARRKLQVLQLSNNFVEDLDGLSCFSYSLIDLDLSGNFIVDHAALLPLSTLSALRSVNFQNNPLACHPKHRQATARYLNKNMANVEFFLDNERLSRYEKSLTGNYDSYKAILVSSVVRNLSVSSNGRNTPESNTTETTTERDDLLELPVGSFRLTVEEKVMNHSLNSQKKLRVRRAVISESESDRDNTSNDKSLVGTTKLNTSGINLESNRDHLETKEVLERLRGEYGSAWLQSQAGHMVRNVIGFDPNKEREYENVAQYKCEKADVTEESSSGINHCCHITENMAANQRLESVRANPVTHNQSSMNSVIVEDLSSLKTQTIPECPTAKIKLSENKATPSDCTGLTSEADDMRYVSIDQGTTEMNVKELLNLTDIYGNLHDQDEDSEVEDNEVLYHVSARDNDSELSVLVSEKSIKEKDAVGRTKTRWGIETLEACERSTSTCITLSFDTMKRDKKERMYEMDTHDCLLLESRLRSILSKRPLSEMNQRLYKCVVCNTKFSREVNCKRAQDDIQCPECRGGYCIEIKDQLMEKETVTTSTSSFVTSPSTCNLNRQLPCSLPKVSDTNVFEPEAMNMNISKQSLDHQEAWESLLKLKFKSSGSLNDSSSCSRVSQPGSSCDSNRSVAGSTNSERDRDVDLLGNESDIEVLSNPSQSSIEVLDRGYHPSRKASEERRISSLEIISDNNSVGTSVGAISICEEEQQHTVGDSMNPNLDDHLNDALTLMPNVTSAQGEEKDYSMIKKSTAGSKLHTAHTSRKGFLANVNLTESSSSGSVTDSVCTAYESNQGQSVDGLTAKTNVRVIGLTTCEQEPSEACTSIQQQTSSASSSANATDTTKSDNSVFANVLGGLFQSTNMLMAKTPKGKSEEESLKKFYEPIRYNYTDYANVDHRLKLFLYQHLFDDANESLKWLVSCIVFDDNHVDEWPSGFEGLFVMSTTKFYVMKKVAAENDDPTSWLKKHIAGTVDRIGIAQPLPWKFGIKFIISAIGAVHIVLQDIFRTDKLILFFNENPLPPYCTLDYQPSEVLINKLKKAANGDVVKMVMVINFCDVVSNDELKSVHLSTLLVTEKHLMLIPDIRWINESSAYPVQPKFTQLVVDIVEFEDINERSCRLSYVDEQEDKEETWSLDFATPTAKESTVNTICHLWETFFGVPMNRRRL